MGQIFKKGQVWDCYKFARNMKGKHNPNMIMEREIGRFLEMIFEES